MTLYRPDFVLIQAQRRNINDWKKLSEQLKAKNAAEVIKERVEDEMEMSDEEAKDEDGDLPPPSKRCKWYKYIIYKFL